MTVLLLIFTLTCYVKVQTREFHHLKSIPIRNFLSNHFCTRKHPRFHYIRCSYLRNSLNINIFQNVAFFKQKKVSTKFHLYFDIFPNLPKLSEKHLLMRQWSVQKSFDIFQSTRFVLLYIHTMVLSRSKFCEKRGSNRWFSIKNLDQTFSCACYRRTVIFSGTAASLRSFGFALPRFKKICFFT